MIIAAWVGCCSYAKCKNANHSKPYEVWAEGSSLQSVGIWVLDIKLLRHY